MHAAPGSPEKDDRVEALRDQLRTLGYLDARVDRFVLGGAASATRPAAFALAASLRIGALAGILLGPAAAIGLRSRAPDLITSAADAVVVALYLIVLFGVPATILSAVAVWLGALAARHTAAGPALSRRARRGALAAGLTVGLLCLVYLTLWWRTATGLEHSSIAWSAAVMGVAAAISLLIGHAVAITVLALLAREGLSAWLRPGLPLSSPRVTIPIGAIAVLGAVTLLVVTAPASTAGVAPALTVVPTGLRAVVIAVDGIDVATLDRLRAAKQVPVFDRLLGQGVATLPTDADRDPARVWTTIATGVPPERHGIRALESRQVAGVGGRLRAASGFWAAIAGATDLVRLTRPAIASGDQRLVPTFWEVAARAGLRTAVVHWWATWPAPDDAGIVLSDRAILRLERGGQNDAEVAPAALYEILRQGATARGDRARARAGGLAAETTDLVSSTLRRSAELDATILELAADPALGTPDLLVVYLPGLDIAQHTLLGSTDASGLAPSVAATRVASLERYYQFLDDAVGRLLAGAEAKNRVVALLMQPGRINAPAGGLLAVSGDVAAATRSTNDITALVPTVLFSLGVPVALDLSNRPALDLFSPSFVQRHPARDVRTYGPRRAPGRAGTGQPLDREMIERMRSLGYVR